MPSSGSSSTTRTFSIEAIWKAVAQSTSSSVPTPASFLAEEIEVLGRPRALARRTAWLRTRAVEVAGDDGDDEEEEQRDDVFGIGDREGVERRQEEEVEGEHADDARRTAPATGRSAPRDVSTADEEDEGDVADVEELAAASRPTPSAAATKAVALEIGPGVERLPSSSPCSTFRSRSAPASLGRR